jgi:hypothetical protein
MEDELRNKLFPLYKDLLKNNTFEDVCTFCVQWGDDFPKKKNSGILFVGKAVNSWVNDETDINILFGNTDKKIFAREDQMEWVYNLEGTNDIYNTKKSAFWRVVKQVSQKYYQDEEWYLKVAWSNLCKIAPFSGGNPNNGLYYQQLKTCQRILSTEIDILSPKVVIMLTSNWESDFLCFLNNNTQPQIEKVIEWNGYQTKLYIIKGIMYVASQHPQGKSEVKHIAAITKLIGKAIE